MSKDKNDSVEIYNKLREAYPSLFPELKRIPNEIKHPGNQPRSPSEYVNGDVTFTSSGDFEEFADKLNSLREITDVRFAVERENLGTERIEVDRSEDLFHDTWNDEDEGCDRTIYGKPQKITMFFRQRAPDFQKLMWEYKDNCVRWENQMSNYRKRKEDIERAETCNRSLIAAACNNRRDLWVMAARALKGDSNASWLAKQVAVAEARLSELKSLLAQSGETESEDDDGSR